MNIFLPDLDATHTFAKIAAKTVITNSPGVFLLYGSIGAGKTTFTRLLVSNLPGGEIAEISSPSFTIYNIYCTTPVVHHFDLYRLENGGRLDDLTDAFDNPGILTIVEWAERIHPKDMPFDGVSCHFEVIQDKRRCFFTSLGNQGSSFLQTLEEAMAL